jgi:hypothetical protein
MNFLVTGGAGFIGSHAGRTFFSLSANGVGGEGRGEVELLFFEQPLSLTLSPLVPRGARESVRIKNTVKMHPCGASSGRSVSLAPQRSAGRGPGRGASEPSQERPRTSSPRPSPPFHGGEGVGSKNSVKPYPRDRCWQSAIALFLKLDTSQPRC